MQCFENFKQLVCVLIIKAYAAVDDPYPHKLPLIPACNIDCLSIDIIALDLNHRFANRTSKLYGIINNLLKQLLYLLRNCIDHGEPGNNNAYIMLQNWFCKRLKYFLDYYL